MGAAKLVPPATVRFCVVVSRKPLLQLCVWPVAQEVVSLVH